MVALIKNFRINDGTGLGANEERKRERRRMGGESVHLSLYLNSGLWLRALIGNLKNEWVIGLRYTL